MADEGPLSAPVAAYGIKGLRIEGKTWDGAGDGQAVELSASRLRATWLGASLSAPAPLGALLSAAGCAVRAPSPTSWRTARHPHRQASRAC